MKLGRTFANVREALERAGRLDDAWYVERATTAGERTAPVAEVNPDEVPYFSLALLPSPAASAFGKAAKTSKIGEADEPGEVTVIGLGPGDPRWLTPEARQAIAEADDLIGYGPYLDRVTTRPGQRKHSSDNRVEAERAAFALDLAKRGRRVAVISAGDPGVFAMAAAVVEVAEDPQWKDVPVRIVPGLTAAQAVAARVGAPLGHDFCVLSLSDRLKPWSAIEARLVAAAGADLVIAIYNPASRSRTEQLVRAREVLLAHRSPETVVVIGRDVGGATESVRVTSLAEFDPATVDMRCLLLVGSSRTRAVPGADGTTRVYTPRHYPGE
jgi:precorrin-2 C20-methyltransferase / precorrin-3B C17-methyltransferase